MRRALAKLRNRASETAIVWGFFCAIRSPAVPAAAFLQRSQSWHNDCSFCRGDMAPNREQLMSTFDNPFDPTAAFAHRVAVVAACQRCEHAAAAQLQIQAAVESEQKRYQGVVASG